MIRTYAARRIVVNQFPTFAVRFNETLLLPWRLTAMAAELAACICLFEARTAVVSAWYTDANGAGSFLDATSETAEGYRTLTGALAVTIVGTFVSIAIFLSAGLLRNEAHNMVQCVRHTVSSILLFMVWYYNWHPIRAWHIWIWFTMVPLLVEVLLAVRLYRRGTYIF